MQAADLELQFHVGIVESIKCELFVNSLSVIEFFVILDKWDWLHKILKQNFQGRWFDLPHFCCYNIS